MEFPNGALFKRMIAFLFPLLVLLAYYSVAFKYFWWNGDDVCLLFAVRKVGLFKLIFNSQYWKSYVSGANFTPWLMVNYFLDYKLFGLNPELHLIPVFFSAVLFLLLTVFALDSEGVSPWISGLFLGLFVITVPFAEVLTLLYTLHYLQGLIFCILAYIFYRKGKGFVSALFYFLACLCKEIYVLFFAFVFLLSFFRGDCRRERFSFCVRLFAWFVASGLIYSLWRYAILGKNIVGGYGFVGKPSLADFVEFHRLFVARSGFPMLIISSVGLVLLWVLFRVMRRLPLVLGVYLLIILPLLPVMKLHETRYYFLPEYLLYVGACLSFSDFWEAFRGRLRIGLRVFLSVLLLELSVLGMFALSHNLKALKHTLYSVRKEGAFFYNFHKKAGESRVFLYRTVLPPWYFQCVEKLKGKNEIVLCDELCMCYESHPDAVFWMYDSKTGRMVRITPSDCGKGVPKKEIAVRMVYNKDTHIIKWHFGPYKKGSYEVIFKRKRDVVKYRVSYSGKVFVNLKDFPPIVVKYVSPEGWSVYTDLIYPEIHGEKVVWFYGEKGDGG